MTTEMLFNSLAIGVLSAGGIMLLLGFVTRNSVIGRAAGALLLLCALALAISVFPSAGILLSSLSTVAMAAIAAIAIAQNSNLQARERKERGLDKILDWACEINNCALPRDISGDIRTIHARSLMEYGRPYSRHNYIRTIARESFGLDLLGSVDEVVRNLTIFMFIYQKRLGIETPEIAFRGSALEIIREERIQDNEIEATYNKYAERLAQSTNSLLVKTGYLYSRL